MHTLRVVTGCLMAMVCGCAAQAEGVLSVDDALGSVEHADLEVGELDVDEDDSVELAVTSQALIGPNDVGVIAPPGMNCPDERIMLTMENEREGNWNDNDGWIGGIQQLNGYTKLNLCRADGRNFARARGTSTSLNYAVIKLGNTCPAGSVELTRYVDNEDRPRGCPSWPRACAVGKPATIGDYAPNSYAVNNLFLKLCMFRANASGSTRPLPALGIPYGVFATPALPGGIASGWAHMDDEDDSNANKLTGDHVGSSVFLTAGANTTFHVTEVNPQPLIFTPITFEGVVAH